MAGCSLTEAFPDTTEQSGRSARKEERKKAKACKGPALSFLQSQDPDRQAERPPPPPEKLISASEHFADFKPIKITGDEANLIGERVDDVIGKNPKDKTLPRATSAIQLTDPTKTMYGEPVPSYFGKSDDTENFADYSKLSGDNPGYQLEGSDFMSAFAVKGLDKAGGGNILPTPSLDSMWKPLSPDSSRTKATTYPAQNRREDNSFSSEEKETLKKKLDFLFAKLEQLESNRNEYAHSEVTLFILSGLFLMFGLETMRKFK
jgi:hypothetical protein